MLTQAGETGRIADTLSLPVLWALDGSPARPGRLDLDPERLTLIGGSRDELRLHEIPLAEVAAVRVGRRPQERIGGRQTLVVELSDGRVVAVVAFGGVGSLHELAESLGVLLRSRAERAPEA